MIPIALEDFTNGDENVILAPDSCTGGAISFNFTELPQEVKNKNSSVLCVNLCVPRG